MMSIQNMHKNTIRYSAYSAVIALFFAPFLATAQGCVFMTVPEGGDIQTSPQEVAKLQVFLKDIRGYDIEVSGVYDPTTDTLTREFLNAYNLSIDPLTEDVRLVQAVNDAVCGRIQPAVSQVTDLVVTTDETSVEDTIVEENTETSTTTSTSGAPSTIASSVQKGTPVGFINEYSLPILIMLFLLLSVQAIYMWGVAPRRRMQIIPREFK